MQIVLVQVSYTLRRSGNHLADRGAGDTFLCPESRELNGQKLDATSSMS